MTNHYLTNYFKTFSTFAISMLCITMPAKGQTIINGGFETPAVASSSYAVYSNGSTAISGWTVSNDAVVVVGTGYTEDNLVFNAHSGNNSLDITGPSNSAGAIYTDISTVNGQTYKLKFYLGNANTSGSFAQYYNGVSFVTVSLDGVSLGNFQNSSETQNAVNWTCYSVTFQGNGGPRRLAFANSNAYDNFAGLDDIAIASVSGTNTKSYGYDALGRLKSVSNDGGAENGVFTSYAYDPASNRQNVTVSGGSC